MKKQKRNRYQHIVDYYDRLLADEHHMQETGHSDDPNECDRSCTADWCFYTYRRCNLLNILDHYMPLQWHCDYDLKKDVGESDEDFERRRRAWNHVDLDTAINLYKYPVSKGQVQNELGIIRSLVRGKDPYVKVVPFLGTDVKPSCYELRLDYLEYRYVLSPHPDFNLWSILRAVIWKYHKTLPIDDPIADAIDDGEFPIATLLARMLLVTCGTPTEKQTSCLNCLCALYAAYFDIGGFPLEVKKQDGRLAVRPSLYRWKADDGVTHEEGENNDGLWSAPIQVIETLRSRYL